MAVLVYILLGLLGIPVFAEGGGPGYILQPTFGYLVAFVLQAWLELASFTTE
jgi:biotin transport system substrate-specific component